MQWLCLNSQIYSNRARIDQVGFTPLQAYADHYRADQFHQPPNRFSAQHKCLSLATVFPAKLELLLLLQLLLRADTSLNISTLNSMFGKKILSLFPIFTFLKTSWYYDSEVIIDHMVSSRSRLSNVSIIWLFNEQIPIKYALNKPKINEHI